MLPPPALDAFSASLRAWTEGQTHNVAVSASFWLRPLAAAVTRTRRSALARLRSLSDEELLYEEEDDDELRLRPRFFLSLSARR